MATFLTEQFLLRRAQWVWRRDLRSMPANFYLGAATGLVVPTRLTVLWSELDEIPAGGGYVAGGWILPPDATGFAAPGLVAIDAFSNFVRTLVQDLHLLAAGDSIPASGPLVEYLAVLDDNVVPADREVFGVIDLEDPRGWPDGEELLITGEAIEDRLP